MKVVLDNRQNGQRRGKRGYEREISGEIAQAISYWEDLQKWDI